MSIDAMSLEKIEERWIPRQADFDAFAVLSGDDNPIHVDPDFSARTRFGRTVSHGMLLYTRISGFLAKHYPDRAQTMQSLMFPNPAFADEELVFEFAPATEDPGVITTRVLRTHDRAVVLDGSCRMTER